MFSGRWETKKEEDGTFFVDRDPFVFRHILNFLRTSKIDLESLTQQESKILIEDAEYYCIKPLVEILQKEPPQFEIKFLPGDNYILSINDKRATKTGQTKWDTCILGNQQVSSGVYVWTLSIVHSIKSYIMVGISPANINRKDQQLYTKCGWYFYCNNSTLHSGPPTSYSNRSYSNTGQLSQDATVSVKLDVDRKTISYIINGMDYGVAYQNIPTQGKLCFCVLMSNANDTVELQVSPNTQSVMEGLNNNDVTINYAEEPIPEENYNYEN